jgi:hypothetical protein
MSCAPPVRRKLLRAVVKGDAPPDVKSAKRAALVLNLRSLRGLAKMAFAEAAVALRLG